MDSSEVRMIDDIIINRSYCMGLGDVRYIVQVEYTMKKPLSKDEWI